MSEANASSNWPPHGEDHYRQQAEVILGKEKANALAAVKLLVFDADGVLTPGNLIYNADGEALKEFHSHDGLGLVMARVAELKRAVLTGRNSLIVQRRCSELRFDAIKLGRFDKVEALEEIWKETGCTPAETLYMGDDLIDLPAMQAAAVAVTVPGAPEELADHAIYQTTTAGGKGAVREVIDLVLKCRRQYGLALTRLLDKNWQPSKQELSSQAEGSQPTDQETGDQEPGEQYQ